MTPPFNAPRVHDDNNASEVPWVKWSEFEESYYKKIRSIFNSSSKSVEPCTLARVMGTKSCKLVYAHLRSDLREESVSEAQRACKADRNGLEKDVGGGRGKRLSTRKKGPEENIKVYLSAQAYHGNDSSPHVMLRRLGMDPIYSM
jgi:hypothetical protein